MHEAKIASLILNKTNERLSGYEDCKRVELIKIAVGKFRNVDNESLQFAFESLKSDFFYLKEAKLEIEEIEIAVLCEKNEHRYIVDFAHEVRCPECGSGVGKFETGQELEIRKIQIVSSD